MFKKLKSIDVVFENCESISIPAGMANLHTSGIKLGMHSCNTDDYDETLTCDRAGLHIYPEGVEYLKTCEYNSFSGMTAYDRIFKYNDITHVEYNLEDGTNKYITVPWKGNYYYNRLINITKFIDHMNKERVYVCISNDFVFKSYIKYMWYKRYIIKHILYMCIRFFRNYRWWFK